MFFQVKWQKLPLRGEEMMRRIAVLLCLCFLGACSRSYTFPTAVTQDAVTEGSQVIFLPSVGVWSNGGMAEDRIVFTKHVSVGSGSYSEYVSDKQTLYLPSTYEFLYQGRLIGYSAHDLKFYETVYKDGRFVTDPLAPTAVAEIFPSLPLVLISSAQNGEITVDKPFWRDEVFLLLNDTNESYYHYSFEDYTPPASPFKSYLVLDRAETLVFSHFGSSDMPVLRLKISNSW